MADSDKLPEFRTDRSFYKVGAAVPEKIPYLLQTPLSNEEFKDAMYKYLKEARVFKRRYEFEHDITHSSENMAEQRRPKLGGAAVEPRSYFDKPQSMQPESQLQKFERAFDYIQEQGFVPPENLQQIVLEQIKLRDILMQRKLVFAFDFDGVLAIPYSAPEVLFAGTEKLLRQLKADGHVIVVTSFNPRAYHVLRPLLEEGVITAIRAGSCVKWWVEGGTYQDDVHRVDMFKSLHLLDMMSNELAGIPIEHVFFVDDDPKNVDEVTSKVYHCPVSGHHVPWYAGFGGAKLKELLNSLS